MRVGIALVLVLLLTACHSDSGESPPDPPSKPQQVNGFSRDTHVELQWSLVSEASYYEVTWSTDINFPGNATYTESSNVNEFIHWGLDNGTTYHYKIRAVGPDGASAYTTPLAVTPQAPPSTPQGFMATVVDGEITLQWDDIATATLFDVYFALEPGLTPSNYTDLQGSGMETNVSNPYTRGGFEDGRTYYFIVTASNSSGTSERSLEVSATLPPGIPQDITQLPGNGAVGIQWSTVNYANAYNVYFASEPGITKENILGLADGKIVSVNAPKADIEGLVNGKTYYYAIAANNNGGESGLSEEQDVLPENPMTIDAGGNHTCSLRPDRSIWCWGSNVSGQMGDGNFGEQFNRASPVRVGGESDWNAVAAGLAHSCAINIGGSLFCWGKNTDGQLGIDTTFGELFPIQVNADTDWSEISTGPSHTCATKRNGALFCWGRNSDGQLGIGTWARSLVPLRVGIETYWKDIIVGNGNHTCAINNSNELWCWGKNTDGQLGDNTTVAKNVPVRISNQLWRSVALGLDHSCGIQMDGSLWCWGDNYVGQLGNGDSGINIGLLAPFKISSDTDWVHVAAGDLHTCAIRSTGQLYCWGSNITGQLGLDSENVAFAYTPTLVGADTDWNLVTAGVSHTCAVKLNGIHFCWGLNQSGQLGNQDDVNVLIDQSYIPVPVGSSADWSSITTGQDFACGVRGNVGSGTIWCWGENSSGQLGNGSNFDRSSPFKADAEENVWQSLADGFLRQNCAIQSNGSLWCWGPNPSGLLGVGIETDIYSPMQLGTDTDWQQVAGGDFFTCAIKKDVHTLYCWGDNSNGQLGNGAYGSSAREFSPAQVGLDTDWMFVAAGDNFTCAIKLNNLLYCWGDNSDGQTGSNSGVSRDLVPVMVSDELDPNDRYTFIASGFEHSCGIRTDDTLWCWGSGWDNKINDTTIADVLTPVQITQGISVPTWQHVAMGDEHTCGIQADGTMWCWGGNSYGQSGGESIGRVTPMQQVGTDTDWIEVSAGRYFTCARKNNGTVWCWGSNVSGQLGNGAIWAASPQLVKYPN